MHGTPGNNQVDALRALIALNGNGGGSLARQPWTNTAFFVDPSNVSGTASDANTGLTPSTAILTTAELNRRLLFKIVTVNSLITYLSDDNSGTVLDLSSPTVGSTGSLSFKGTPQVLHTGGTLNAGTIAINPSAPGGGQRQTAHTTDLATFAPFTIVSKGGAALHPCYLVDTTGGNSGTSAWIVNGGATANLSRPMDSTFVSPGTLTIGDSYRIQRGSLLAVGGAMVEPQFTRVTFTDFAFTLNSVTAPGSFLPFYFRCSTDNTAFSPGGYLHGFFASDISFVATGAFFIDAGVWLLAGSTTAGTLIELTNDVYITDTPGFVGPQALVCSPTVNANISILNSLGPPSGVQLQDITDTVAAMIIGSAPPNLSGQPSGAALIWGNGNTGFGIALELNGLATVPANAGFVPSVTGALGDFCFIQQSTGTLLTVARAFDPSTGEYTEIGGPATRTTTWAHFVAALGAGGFNFQAHNPETNAHIVGQ